MALLSPEGRLALYSGALRTGAAPALDDLIGHVRHMVANGFFRLDPERAHRSLDPGDYRARVVALRKGFNTDTAVRSLAGKLVKEWGGDPADAYFDTLKLRISPPVAEALRHPLAPLPAHRDTWGSNVMQQINVWAPLTPLAKGRTLALWPDMFRRAVANDSAAWDLDELIRRRGKGATDGYPLMPTASAPPPITDAQRLMPAVGEAMLFSGAHLHASVPNRTPLARLNIELRIVFLADRTAGVGAPNVDGHALRTPLHWFRSLDGARALTDATPLMLA